MVFMMFSIFFKGRVYTTLVYQKVKKWLANSNFELDTKYPEGFYMGNRLNFTDDPLVDKGLGYSQYDIFIPIRLK